MKILQKRLFPCVHARLHVLRRHEAASVLLWPHKRTNLAVIGLQWVWKCRHRSEASLWPASVWPRKQANVPTPFPDSRKAHSAAGCHWTGIAGVQLLESFPFSAQGQRAVLMTPAPEGRLRGLTRAAAAGAAQHLLCPLTQCEDARWRFVASRKTEI